MKAKWVNIVDSLQGNVDGRMGDRNIDRSNREPTYRNIEKSIYRRGKKENKANNK